MPTVTVVSDGFTMLAEMAAKGVGMAGLPFVVVPHPVATRSSEELRAQAHALTDEVLAALTAADGGGDHA